MSGRRTLLRGGWAVRAFSSIPSRTPVRVRFAPSPTGFLHVGGLRTALLNHLLARHTGGTWVLRIEDTDQSRLVPGATQALQESLAWAGLHYDEGPDREGAYGPYVQSQRLALYRAYADRLLAEGKAYRDFRPPVPRDMNARTSALLREAYLPPSNEEAQARLARGETCVIRLRMDAARTYTYEDAVYGTMTFKPDVMAGVTDDPIIVKSDGWPTYHLASVVDDTEMRITHVLRGEEWIPSMPKHLALYEAFETPPPVFAHLPLLINADGTKLSKRSGDVRVEDYKQRGWEPETLVNLVALTGYHHRDTTSPDHDVKTMTQLVEHFDITHIAHARATLPLDKLAYLNRHHMARKIEAATTASDAGVRDEVVTRLRAALTRDVPDALPVSEAYLLEAARLGQQRVDTLDAIPAQTAYLFREPDWSSPACQAFRASVPTPTFRHVVQAAYTFFCTTKSARNDWATWMKDQVAHLPGSGGKAAVQKSVRIALTGERAGPPVAEIADVLGLDRAAERMEAALAWDETHAPS
ncbi:Glutamate--tRNA ligase mitochondrial [Malassezia pachydermatis]|uniref:glutamate--tRNA ligase n=1 Tax=Malassezia pachydermatis TaxID=77020 RepID=A0A0M8MQG0_9BASI|nr:glutamyl-trna synthetase [Malassezia pachydermatis]KOS16268.1 glutamyl-trna synthetase [Malassezia pachydermatis]